MLIPNLIWLYHVMAASENLLRVAIVELPPGVLRRYFEKHLEEERGHAKWLAADLRSVNIEVERTQIPLVAAQMAGSIYYLIFHAHPAALLGYMQVLESWPMDKAKLAESGKDYPRVLLRTVNHHIEHDPAHLKEILAMIAAQPEHAKLIADVAVMTRNHLQQAAREIMACEPFTLRRDVCQAAV
jgi:hypothetical protein